jgi:hypothetical protein
VGGGILDRGLRIRSVALKTNRNLVGAAEGCDLVILIFLRSKDRSLRQLLQVWFFQPTANKVKHSLPPIWPAARSCLSLRAQKL